MQEQSSGRKRLRRRVVEWAFVVFLVAGGFLFRVWPLSKAHFWDECVYLQNAEVICCGKTNYSELDSRPPLLSLIFAAAFLLWHHVYAASIVTALLNALAPALLYASGRLIIGRIPAAIASLLLAFLPFFVGIFPAGFAGDDTGNSLLSDSPAVTLIVLAFWLLVLALRKQSKLLFACAGFVLALTVLMRFASLSSVGVLSLMAFAAERWWKSAISLAAGFTAGLGPYLCWSRLRYGGFLTTFRNGWKYFQGPTEPFFYYVRNFANIFSWITLAGLALWIARRAWEQWGWRVGQDAAAAIPATAQEHSRRLERFLWLWAAILVAFFSALRHKELRYVMPVAPPVLLLAGSGLGAVLAIRKKALRLVGSALVAAGLLVTFLPLRERFESPFIDDEPSEEMQVSEFLNNSVPPGTTLYSNFNYPLFAYYTNLPVHRLPETGPTLYRDLNHLPSDGIFIAYKPGEDIAEPRLEWLDANTHFHRLREFPSMVIYEYRTNLPRR